MRRARGSGGRFLNTKKLEGNASNSTSQEQTKCGTATPTQSGNSSGSELISTDRNGHSDHTGKREHVFSNGNSSELGTSPFYYSQSNGSDKRDVLSMGLVVNQALRGSSSSN